MDPEETLVVVVSKTFTTAETMLNARTVRQWLWDRMAPHPDPDPEKTTAAGGGGSIELGGADAADAAGAAVALAARRRAVTACHVVACASSSAGAKVEAFGVAKARSFQFWDWVGGRFSVCSAAGLVPLSLAFGFDLMKEVTTSDDDECDD